MAPRAAPKASEAGPDPLGAVAAAKERWKAFAKAMRPFPEPRMPQVDVNASKRLEEALKWAEGPGGAALLAAAHAPDAGAGALAPATCFAFVAAEAYHAHCAAGGSSLEAAARRRLGDVLLRGADGLAAATAAVAPARSLWAAVMEVRLLEYAAMMASIALTGSDPPAPPADKLRARALAAAVRALRGGWEGGAPNEPPPLVDLHLDSDPAKGFGGDTGARRAPPSEAAAAYVVLSDALAGLQHDLKANVPEELQAALLAERRAMGDAKKEAAKQLAASKVDVKCLPFWVSRRRPRGARGTGPSAGRGARRAGAPNSRLLPSLACARPVAAAPLHMPARPCPCP
jgi:hypothetical protein